ncbi:MAG: hypothetical protein QM607_09310 [Microbacterium sp.]
MQNQNELPEGDEELLAEMRSAYAAYDDLPAGLTNRLIAAIAVEDVDREFDLLTLVEGAAQAAVRSVGGLTTLEFSDDGAQVLVQIGPDERGDCRVDGWTSSAVFAAKLLQDDGAEWSAIIDDGAAKFSFPKVPTALSRVRLVVEQDGGTREIATPWFELKAA